jgi:hypothetical protein
MTNPTIVVDVNTDKLNISQFQGNIWSNRISYPLGRHKLRVYRFYQFDLTVTIEIIYLNNRDIIPSPISEYASKYVIIKFRV